MSYNFDLGSAFDKWVDQSFFNYRGVLIERLNSGYKCMGIFCLNMKDVDRVLDSGRSDLGNSIKKSNNGAK